MSIDYKTGDEEGTTIETAAEIRRIAVRIRDCGLTIHITEGHADKAPGLCGDHDLRLTAAVALDMLRAYPGAFEDFQFHDGCIKALAKIR